MTFIAGGRRGRRRNQWVHEQRVQARAPGNPQACVMPLAALALLLGAVLFYVGSLRYSIPEAVAAVLLAAAVVSLIPWAIGATGIGADRAYWATAPRQESTPPAALDYRLVRLRRDLRDAIERDDRTDEIYPVLRDLAAERLRAHHGIDLETQPELARQVVDDHLWRYLTTPPTDTRKRSRTSLQTAIEGIEKL